MTQKQKNQSKTGHKARNKAKGLLLAAKPWWDDFWRGVAVTLHALGLGLFWLGKQIIHVIVTPRLWVRPSLFVSSYIFIGAYIATFGILQLTRTYTPPEDADFWKVNRPASITLLDRDGNEIGVRGSHYGDPVALDELPPFVIDAFVATEDRRFYRHHGLDPRGLARAALTNIKAGRMREGASTITQQLARNLFLTSERSLDRKLLEAHLAIWLENRLSKDEILTLYLNRIYLGSGAYGIEAASNFYFSKPAKELTLSEAAMLAALPKAPSTLSPVSNFDGALTRSWEVLDNLVEAAVIDPEMVALAKVNPPVLDPKIADNDFGYFLDYALIQAKKILGEFDSDIVITTTLDSALQKKAEETITAILDEDALALGAEQAALIAYNEKGDVIALVGGKSYEESQFNRATQAKRQPGSAFKPIVYLAAIEYGLTPRSLFIDQEVDVDGWQPTNYSNTYQGPVRLAEAMAKSINTVAVQVTEMVGRDTIIEAAKRLGIKSQMRSHPSIALGTMEVTLDELTSAYLPFARQGRAAQPHVIAQIVGRDGTMIYEMAEEPDPERIMTPQTSKTMNHLLFQVIHGGTGRRANLGRRPAVGKTGTTNDWRDAWFVGYTAQITAGVWVGNDENTEMDHVTGGSLPAVIWHDFMLAAHEGLPVKAIPGAKPAVSEAADQRLASFYGNLERDFSDLLYTAYAREYPYQEGDPLFDDTYQPNQPDQVKGRPANEDDKKKRRRWFRFGRD